MPDYRDEDRVLALAGVFQGARLAREIARKGMCDVEAFEASRSSLFVFDSDATEAIFGGVAGIRQGLRTLAQQLDRETSRDIEIARYAVAVIHLGDRARRDSGTLKGLGDDLAALDRRRAHFELTDSVQNQQLAKIYQDRISVLGPRIIVRGEPLHLQNPDNAARVRVALLAGVRAAVLWRQTGGRKWQLLLRRRRLWALASELASQD
jgi:high frequency lysogenization protein